MPKSDDLATEFKSLQELAMKIDENPDQADELVEAIKASESRPEPVQDDKQEAPQEETPEVETAEMAEIEPDKPEPGDSDKIRKDKERLARNWQVMQERNKEAKIRMEVLEAEARNAKEEVARLKAQAPEIAETDRRGNSVRDYERFADSQENEGNYQAAKNAREEAQFLKQQIAEKQFLSKWQATQAEMVEANPDLGNPSAPLNREVEKLLREPDNVYITRPTGLKAAVAQAKANLMTDSISAIRAENEKLKQELDRLAKLGAIPGRDGAMKRGGLKAFADMTLEEQHAQLLRQSEELDAEAMRY